MNVSPQHRNIFLVDDDQDDREMFTSALSMVDENANVTELFDGQQLMDALSNNPSELPDYIFLDLNMPKCGGMECLDRMRQMDVLSKVTVAVLSTSSNPDSIAKAHNFGASFYIVKPTNFSNLKAFIAKVLNEGSLERKPKTIQEFLVVA